MNNPLMEAATAFAEEFGDELNEEERNILKLIFMRGALWSLDYCQKLVQQSSKPINPLDLN